MCECGQKALVAPPAGRGCRRKCVDVEKRSWLTPRRGEGACVWVDVEVLAVPSVGMEAPHEYVCIWNVFASSLREG